MNYFCLYLVSSAGCYQTWACRVDGYRYIQYVTFCLAPFTDPEVVSYTPDYGTACRAADFLDDYDRAFNSWRTVDHNYFRKYSTAYHWPIDPNRTDYDRYFYGSSHFEIFAPEITFRKEFLNLPDFYDLDDFDYDPAFYGGL